MIYVFEDNKKDPLPQLFMKSYSREISSKFVYTEGNGNIYNKVESLLCNNDIILVYLDTILGNDSTRKIYYKLASLSRKHKNRIIVLPILGLEYYFIKSIQYEPVIISKTDIDICVNRNPENGHKMPKNGSGKENGDKESNSKDSSGSGGNLLVEDGKIIVGNKEISLNPEDEYTDWDIDSAVNMR